MWVGRVGWTMDEDRSVAASRHRASTPGNHLGIATGRQQCHFSLRAPTHFVLLTSRRLFFSPPRFISNVDASSPSNSQTSVSVTCCKLLPSALFILVTHPSVHSPLPHSPDIPTPDTARSPPAVRQQSIHDRHLQPRRACLERMCCLHCSRRHASIGRK